MAPSKNKEPIASLTDSFDEMETVRSGFKPGRLVAPNADLALMGSRPSAGSQGMQDYSWASPWGHGFDAPEPSDLAKRLPSSKPRSGEHPPTGRYTGCHAGAGVDQINGVVVVVVVACGSEAAGCGLEAPGGTYLYRDCTKEGHGVQVNGLEVVYHGGDGSQVPTHPGMDGQWHGMVLLPGEGEEMKGTKHQINGGRVRKMMG